MSESLLYRLHSHGNNGVTADTNRFEDVFASRFRKVRIFRVKGVDKESKEWVGSPLNTLAILHRSFVHPYTGPPCRVHVSAA